METYRWVIFETRSWVALPRHEVFAKYLAHTENHLSGFAQGGLHCRDK